MEYLPLFLSFVLGILAARSFSILMTLGQLGLMVKEVEKNCLMMFASVAESVAYIQSIKFQTMTDLKLEENVIKRTQNIDEHNFKMWKNSAVKNLHASYPDRFKDEAKYYDWKTAMDFLDRVYQQNRIDKNKK
jgi:hypothetical protein|tara:strand:+ start:479 stop:877 length:399 start_codon:yes stop_codon:yes gene_type:complete